MSGCNPCVCMECEYIKNSLGETLVCCNPRVCMECERYDGFQAVPVFRCNPRVCMECESVTIPFAKGGNKVATRACAWNVRQPCQGLSINPFDDYYLTPYPILYSENIYLLCQYMLIFYLMQKNRLRFSEPVGIALFQFG